MNSPKRKNPLHIPKTFFSYTPKRGTNMLEFWGHAQSECNDTLFFVVHNRYERNIRKILIYLNRKAEDMTQRQIKAMTQSFKA